MIKKLIISGIVLAALISGKEAHAAGPAGFARGLSAASTSHLTTGSVPTAGRHEGVMVLTLSQLQELHRVNSVIESTIAGLDDYFDGFTGARPLEQHACFDCADLKRDHLISLGWSQKAMRIAYAVDGEGLIERVLVIATDRGDVVLGTGSPAIGLSGSHARSATKNRAPAAPAVFIDI